MELSQVNKGFNDDDGNPIEDVVEGKGTKSVRNPCSLENPGLNYDTILDEIGQFGR